MSITNGQRVDAANTNAAFVSKTTDSTTVGKLTLNKPAEGAQVESVQKAVNKIYEGLGTTGQNDTDINNYANNNYVADGDSRKVAIEKLDLQTKTNSDDISDHELRITNVESGVYTFTGDKTFSDNVVIQGTLNVNGTPTIINSTILEVSDANIIVNNGGNDASSEGAGLTVERTGTSGSLAYENALASKFKIGDLGSEQQIVTVGHTQTLTNKSLTGPVVTDFQTNTETTTPATPSAGFRRLYAKADGYYELDSTGLEKKVGAGSGGGAVNLITNGNADDAASSIFIPYSETVSSRPTTGSGGSPTVTTSITSTNPLNGTKSYLLTKPAVNSQGQGWSIPFTVDPGYRAKALNISVSYIVNSGTFVAGTRTTDSDVIWYLYDVTNSQLIEPSNIKMFSNSSTISDVFTASFQTSVTGSSYRLIAHVATTSALAYELKVDNVTVSPSSYVYGTPVTDWVAYTPTVANLGTGGLATNTAKWRRVGDSIELEIFSVKDGSAGSGATQVTWSIPAGLSVDTAKLGNSASSLNVVGNLVDAQSGFTGSVLFLQATNSVYAYAVQPTTSQFNGATFSANKTISIIAKLPIVGWSSSVQTSDQTDTRVVAASLTGSSSSITSAINVITPTSILFDTHGAFVTDTYTVPVSGYYEVSAFMQLTSASYTAGNSIVVYTRHNATDYPMGLNRIEVTASTSPAVSGSFVINAKQGDTIKFAGFSSVTTTVAGATSFAGSIRRLTGPSAIASTESMNAKYSNTAGTTIGTGSQTLTFPTRLWDSHNSFSSNTTYTPSISGKFSVNLKFTANTISGLSTCKIRILVNGSTVSEKSYAQTYSTASPYTWDLNDEINVLSNDAITFQFENGFGTSITSSTTVGHNSVSITRVGN
jgi:hypothetical protein